MIYIKDKFYCNQIKWSSNNNRECIALIVTLAPQMSFVLVVQYRPPSSNNRFYKDLKNILKECDSGKEIILMGDFNINWEDKTNRKALKRNTDNFDLTQLISGPTRITTSSQTQIDLIFSNRTERVVKSFNFRPQPDEETLREMISKCFAA